jgi:hypothetical protein
LGIGVILIVGGNMVSGQLMNNELITINRQELYEIVTMAVYDAISRLDFLTVDEIRLREDALEELESGEAVHWNDYLKERGIHP